MPLALTAPQRPRGAGGWASARVLLPFLGALTLGTAIGTSSTATGLRLVLGLSGGGTVLAGLSMAPTRRPEGGKTVGRAGRVLFGLLLAVLVLATLNPRTKDISRYDQLVALAVSFTFVLVVARLVVSTEKVPLAIGLLLAYLAVIALNGAVARLFSVDGAAWARRAFVASSMPLAAAGAWLAGGAHRARRLVWAVVALCAGIAVYYLTLFHPGDSLLQVRGAYKGAFFQTGGTYSAAIVATVTFPFLLARTRWRLILGPLFLLGLAGVAVTFARTFWVTTPAALALSVAALKGHRLGRRVGLGLATVLVVSLLIQGTGPGSRYAALAGERLTQRNMSGTFRVEEAGGLLHAMRADPTTLVLGAGLGNTFSFHSTDPYAIGGVGVTTRDYSHNWYLEVLWTLGVVGLVVVVAFLASVCRMLLVALRRAPSAGEPEPWDRFLCAGLLGTFVNFTLAAVTYHPFGILLWNLVLGLLAGAACSLAGPVRAPAHAPAPPGRWSTRRW